MTPDALRAIPVANLTKMAGARHVLYEEGDGTLRQRALLDEDVDRIKRDGPTDQALRLVAYLYRLALVVGEPPTQTVERNLRLARSTAGRWVSLARKRGFLGKAEGAGKAGG